jgi:hypothetical protein
MEAEALGVKAASGATLLSTAFVSFTAGCCLSDTFNLNSAVPKECWDPGVSYANFYPMTHTTWADIADPDPNVQGETPALEFDLANGMLLYRDSGKADSSIMNVTIAKPVELPSQSWQLEAKVSNTGGYKMFHVGVDVDSLAFSVMSDATTGYTIGLQAILDGGYKQVCHAMYLENGALIGASYLPCDVGDMGGEVGTDFIFRLSYNRGAQDVLAEVSFDDGLSWHDIVAEGTQFPSATHEYLDFLDFTALTDDVYASIGGLSADDGATKNNTADIEYVRFKGLESLDGATPPQFNDGEYEEPGTFAMNLGGTLLDVQNYVTEVSINPNDTDVRIDQGIAAIFDDDPSPMDWNSFLPSNIYLEPAQPLTGQPPMIWQSLSGLEIAENRAALIEVLTPMQMMQEIGDMGAYMFQKQDVILHIEGLNMENGYLQRNVFEFPFRTSCAMEDDFFQDLRTDCYYTASNTDVSTVISAAGSELEITRTGAAGVYEIMKPATQNDGDQWMLQIKVNISNMDRTWASTDSIMLRLTDSPDGDGEGFHIGVMATEAITMDGDYEMVCVAGRTNDLGQYIEFLSQVDCEFADGQDIIVALQPGFGSVNPMWSIDGSKLFAFNGGNLGVISSLGWNELYLNLEATFTPTSSMQIDLDRINPVNITGRSAAELDTSDYMFFNMGGRN